jgi:hypothetical protein
MIVVCWKWKPMKEYRSKHDHTHVNTLFSMVKRHYSGLREFVCITDDPKGLHPDIRVIPIWDDHAELRSPHGGLNPACYRRLKMYSPEMREIIGERFVSLDLDCVITADVTPVWDRPDKDFMIWGETLRTTPYNGSMQMMTAGARKQIWEQFDPVLSPQQTVKAGYHGSDQAWISYKLGPHEARWTQKDGVFSWRMACKPEGGRLPKGARIIFFEGHVDPWTPTALKMSPWIADHYR